MLVGAILAGWVIVLTWASWKFKLTWRERAAACLYFCAVVIFFVPRSFRYVAPWPVWLMWTAISLSAFFFLIIVASLILPKRPTSAQQEFTVASEHPDHVVVLSAELDQIRHPPE